MLLSKTDMLYPVQTVLNTVWLKQRIAVIPTTVWEVQDIQPEAVFTDSVCSSSRFIWGSDSDPGFSEYLTLTMKALLKCLTMCNKNYIYNLILTFPCAVVHVLNEIWCAFTCSLSTPYDLQRSTQTHVCLSFAAGTPRCAAHIRVTLSSLITAH